MLDDAAAVLYMLLANILSEPVHLIRSRAENGGMKAQISNHTFRATGITGHLKIGGRLEIAQQMANYESA